jgi:hypothetical protein
LRKVPEKGVWSFKLIMKIELGNFVIDISYRGTKRIDVPEAEREIPEWFYNRYGEKQHVSTGIYRALFFKQYQAQEQRRLIEDGSVRSSISGVIFPYNKVGGGGVEV